MFRRNAFVAVVAMLYSVYALWASGKDAVMGGMLVMGIGYIVYGFIAPRFVGRAGRAPRGLTAPRRSRKERPCNTHARHAGCAHGCARALIGSLLCLAAALPALAAGTLDKATRQPAS